MDVYFKLFIDDKFTGRLAAVYNQVNSGFFQFAGECAADPSDASPNPERSAMAETAREAAAANLSASLFRIFPDPGPAWIFSHFEGPVQQELIQEYLKTQQTVLQAVAESLGRQADIIARQRR